MLSAQSFQTKNRVKSAKSGTDFGEKLRNASRYFHADISSFSQNGWGNQAHLFGDGGDEFVVQRAIGGDQCRFVCAHLVEDGGVCLDLVGGSGVVVVVVVVVWRWCGGGVVWCGVVWADEKVGG